MGIVNQGVSREEAMLAASTNGDEEMQRLAIAYLALLDECENLRERLAVLCEPGTPIAIVNAMFDYAERECGHKAHGYRHAFSTIQKTIKELRRGWRPIETAPKDGSTVFIWYAGECVHAAYLAEHHGRIPNWHLLDKWRNWGPVSEAPKYWRPLPDPPDAAISENAARERE